MRKLFFIIVTAIGMMQIPMQSINAQNMKKEEVPQNISAFPVGKANTGFEQYFTGRSWLAPLTGNKDLNVPMSNVTFEPGCRNNWHSHTGGQLLIAVGGVGYYQERGKAARRLLPGDVVEIAPNIEHWHGAAPDSWFSHLAIGCNPQTNQNTWLERVDDQQYAEATKGNVAIGLQATDPELDDIFSNFTKEVQEYGALDIKTRLMVTLASNIASQAQLSIRQVRIYFRPFLQFIENIFRPFFFFNQLPCFLLSRRSSQYPRMCLRHLFRQRNLLSGCAVQKG